MSYGGGGDGDSFIFFPHREFPSQMNAICFRHLDAFELCWSPIADTDSDTDGISLRFLTTAGIGVGDRFWIGLLI